MPAVNDISDWRRLYDAEKRDFKKAGKIAACAALGGLVAGPAALCAAPVIGGAIGTTFMGLYGVAATNAGLAFLGGGSIAAGGFGMAGGAATVTACGTALGGALFGRVGQAYFGAVEGFDIKLAKKGDSPGAPAVIVINGFLNADEDPLHEWHGVLGKYFQQHRWYHLAWESKRLKHLGQLIGQTCSTTGAGAALGSAALKASKKAWRNFAPFHALIGAADLLKNPWHVAFLKAQTTGRLLADILSRVQGDHRYVLLGHSLGSSVIFWALNELATKSCNRIDAAHIFGGPSVNSHTPIGKRLLG